MHTEGRARSKWCPFARVPYWDEGEPPAVAINRFGDGGIDDVGNSALRFRCIASDCMSWRWDTKLNDDIFKDAREVYRDTEDPEPWRDSPEWQDAKNRRHGYCGLSGTPE